MIEGVRMAAREIIVDERGKIMHMIKRSDKEFGVVGEVYFSWINPGVVKGWHLHSEMTLNYCCPHGLIKLVLYDDRVGSPTRGEVQEIYLGPECYYLVQIPPAIWNGFRGIAVYPSMLCNVATTEYREGEMKRLPWDDCTIPYTWAIKNG
ncbi:MAG: dTDP-4-dehydrorhamnose 3,5-epimerase family protein [Acidobacteriota bacterium]